MPEPAQPELLPPENPASARPITLRQRAQHWFSDENIDFFAHLLDDWFRIPFTPFRIGLDGLIGLIPGLGDILAGIASFVIILAAWIRGVPWVTLVRMTVNLGLEVVIGTIPLFGDIFDIAWKANRRNYQLMVRHLRQPHRHTWKDYAFLLSLLGAVLFILAIPFIALLLLTFWFVRNA
ncbi:MAG TPA: DUF4112 domain-containing protein [Acidobacteriaceae bacterium]|nr:DUF4112 domain-containing protein [Acidobacteriaceae bacterium]